MVNKCSMNKCNKLNQSSKSLSRTPGGNGGAVLHSIPACLTSIYRDPCPAPCLLDSHSGCHGSTNDTSFFLGLQIFLPRVTEKLDKIPKDPSADPEDQDKVPKVPSTTAFGGNSLQKASARGECGERPNSSAIPDESADWVSG